MATIVTLGAGSIRVKNFNDEFGEFSQANGKGRARRKKRKLERIEDKKEVQAARADKKLGKIENKRAIKTARVDSKNEVKTNRGSNRIGRRANKQNLRDTKKIDHKKNVLQKRNVFNEEKLDEKDLPVDQEPQETDQNYDYGAENKTGGDYMPEDNSGGGGGFSEDSEEGGDAGTDIDDGDRPDFEEDEDFQEDEGDDSETEDELDMNFDGIMVSNDLFCGLPANIVSEIDLSPEIADVALQIEGAREKISNLNISAAKALAEGEEVYRFEEKVREQQQRILDLKGVLDRYANHTGEFKSTNDSTEFVNIEGAKKPKKSQKKKRILEISKGMAMAREKRNQFREKKNKPTVVEKNLNPKFSNQKIQIPGTSNATGVNALDLMQDYDAPRSRIVELTSNFDGPKAGKGIKIETTQTEISAPSKYAIYTALLFASALYVYGVQLMKKS